MNEKIQDKPTVLIIQSGAMGDIYLIAPIARHYAINGYCVFWPVREPYFNLVEKYFPYVSAGLVEDEKYPKLHDDWLRSDTMHLKKLGDSGIYDRVVNLADRGIKPLQLNSETFEETKYRIAGVPIHYRNHLLWTRNKVKEYKISRFVTEKHGIDTEKDEFVLAHLESSNDGKEPMPEDEKRFVVEVEKVPGCEIADWFLVASRAEAIYAVESSFHQFIEGAINRVQSENPSIELYLLSRASLTPGTRYTNSWEWDKKHMK